MLESSSTWATQAHSPFFAGIRSVSSNQTPPPDRKKMVMIALTLGFAALFMYVSFIIKTAVKGP